MLGQKLEGFFHCFCEIIEETKILFWNFLTFRSNATQAFSFNTNDFVNFRHFLWVQRICKTWICIYWRISEEWKEHSTKSHLLIWMSSNCWFLRIKPSLLLLVNCLHREAIFCSILFFGTFLGSFWKFWVFRSFFYLE